MIYEEFEKIVKAAAHELSEDAAHMGARNDGGSGVVISRLETFRKDLIIEKDLRPSEYSNIKDFEVGNPVEFKDEILEHHKRIAEKNIEFN